MTESNTARKNWDKGPAIFTSLEHYQTAVIRASDDDPLSLRSIYWKVFLLFRDNDRSRWSSQLSDARSAYDTMRSRFRPVAVESAGSDDPLSDQSPMREATDDNDEVLLAEIAQDVLRCMPDLDHFRDPQSQKLLTDILFVHAKLNPDLGYRQGMHELLAPILWVVRHDAIFESQANKADQLTQLCDAKYIEHDAFTLFNIVMQNAKSFYEPTAHASQNPMLVRIESIFTDQLARLDQRLATHLARLQLLPQIFLLRWIRLLFAREFSFDDLLPVWDVIFAESPDLELVNQICLVLLLQLRWELIDADHNTALTLLLKYPDLPFDLTPRQLAIDAIQLRNVPTAEKARALVKKYSGKEPTTETPRLETLSLRTPTKEHASASRFPFSPPRISPSLAGNLEALLQDAAKTVYSRGETWGINQAVRDAVDEVRKGVHEISTMPTPQAPPFHPYRSSPRSTSSLEALVQRNKDIGIALQSAIDELWDFQKQATEGITFDQSTIEALSAAIARVQFAQVYLQDSSVPVHAGDTPAPNHPRVKIDPPSAAPSTSGSKDRQKLSTPTKSQSGPTSRMLGRSQANASPQRAQRSPGQLSSASSFLFGDSESNPLETTDTDASKFTLFDQDDEDAFDISALKKNKQ